MPLADGGQRELAARRNTRFSVRRVKAGSFWFLGLAAVVFVVLIVVDILVSIVSRGLHGLSLSIFTTDTSGIAGGLQNAILGTLDLTGLSMLFAGPIGILGGIYMAFFARSWIGSVLRFATEVSAGIPSIVVGYFGYTVMVVKWGFGVSLLAGALSLAILVLPYIVRTTEASLRQVPTSYWEGALALGLRPATALRTVMMRPALPGIFTGLLLAVSIGLGETAPLIYTAGWANFNPTWGLTKNPVGYLTYVVWTYLNEPFPAAHQLAYTAALLIVALVLLAHVAVRLLQRPDAADRRT